ncbi:MAG: histidine kinase [Treponema sp.]|nr:histidine kinase [Treponema sp.]
MPFEIADLTREIGVYIRLVWLFAVIITVLMLLLCYLYLAMRKAIEKESKSLAFSNLAIEGMETERRRVSRELHDVVLPQVRGMEVYDTIREICIELMPPDFSRLSLKDSFVDLCNKFIRHSGTQCAIYIDTELDFTPMGVENQLHLYRIVQEALTNIEKHAKTEKAVLTARRGAGESILICVSNDSALPVSPGTGLGMRSMEQRAVIIGARLDFISETGNGFMVRIEIPRLAGNRG